MMQTLHGLNGDATAHPFASSGLPGDVAIWREMLSEGPLLAVPKSDEELWALRRNWLAGQFGDRIADEDAYEVKIVNQFARICRYADYDEVFSGSSTTCSARSTWCFCWPALPGSIREKRC